MSSKRNPQRNVGFFRFCDLKPKQFVTVGHDGGTHCNEVFLGYQLCKYGVTIHRFGEWPIIRVNINPDDEVRKSLKC
jgi:hypothetical protein